MVLAGVQVNTDNESISESHALPVLFFVARAQTDVRQVSHGRATRVALLQTAASYNTSGCKKFCHFCNDMDDRLHSADRTSVC